MVDHLGTVRVRIEGAGLAAVPDDIVMSERITGVPVSIIRTPWIDRVGTRAGPVARRLLRWRRTRHWLRTAYSLRALWQLRRSSADPEGRREYWQAGRSVGGIARIEPVGIEDQLLKHSIPCVGWSVGIDLQRRIAGRFLALGKSLASQIRRVLIGSPVRHFPGRIGAARVWGEKLGDRLRHFGR